MNFIYQANVKDIIQKYDLIPHPEGGYSRLLHQDPDVLDADCLPKGYNGSRPLWNGIYYLLPEGIVSILHRIRMSELWNFYMGGPLELFDISPSGALKTIILGQNLSSAQDLAYVFPKGHWIAAKPIEGSSFSFVSCITSPGFTFADWEKGNREELSRYYPHLKEVIVMLTE